VLNLDNYLATSTCAGPVIKQPSSGMAWDEIKSLLPPVREESRVVTLTESNSLGAEKFRLLRARLRNLRERQPLQKLVITSAVPNDGKTMVAMNLAVCLAKHTNEKILLLEGDMRRPTLDQHLGIKFLPGIGEWWASVDEPVASLSTASTICSCGFCRRVRPRKIQ
jgi:Mrp family chromosome partitioning ATPase